MRVALDATYSVDPNPSGIAVYSRELMEGLVRLHPDDEFLFCYRPKQLRAAGRPPFSNARRRILQPPFRTFRADLFHSLNQRVDQRSARCVITTFHDLFVMTGEYSSPGFRARFSDQARKAAERSDLIVAVSEFTADQVSYLLRFERSRIRVVPHGVCPPAFVTPDGRKKVILFVGALQKRKNIERLVAAFESVPSEWQLSLAGATTGYGSEEILHRIDQSPARGRINVLGYVARSELQRLYSEAAIFAFPSLDEGFGIPVLEAMAHGVPVVTSNRSALREVAGSAAILVDPLNTDEIREAMVQLASNGQLRADLAIRALERAARFSWEATVQKTYQVYREALS